MKFKFRNSANPISAQDFNVIERLINEPLPTDLKELYLKSNGGSPMKNAYFDKLGDFFCVYFWPLIEDESIDHLTIERAWQLDFGFVDAESEIPIKCIPFAIEETCADPIYYSLDGNNYGSIFLYRHDTAYEKIEFLARSLDEFLLQLKTAPEETDIE